MRIAYLLILCSLSVVAASAQECDATLWKHVYHGTFPTAKNRLKPLRDCITVTGTVVSAKAEHDGDYHIRLRVDPQFKNLLNAKNRTGQAGFLVVEPVCARRVTQADTLEEGVCNGFKQAIFKPSMLNKRVSVSGAYVEDEEHGWREIHPVTSIVLAPE
jgi:hypothetical protein